MEPVNSSSDPASAAAPPAPVASLARRATLSVLWLGAAQVARRISGLAITVVLARLLSPDDYGLMAMAGVALGLLANLSEMGVATALVQRDELDERTVSTAFWSAFLTSLLVTVVGLAVSPLVGAFFDDPKAVGVFRALLLTLPLASLSQVPDALLQRGMRFKAISTIEWTVSVLSGVVGIAVAYLGGGVWALVAQSASSSLMGGLAKAVAARWRPHALFDLSLARQLLSFGGFVMGGMILNHVVTNMDNAIVGAQLGAEALGYYAMAFTLAMLPSSVVSGLLGRVLFPVLATLKSEPARFRSAYLRTLRSVTLVTFPLMASVAVLAHEVVALAYGARWAASVPMLQVLCVVAAVQGCNQAGAVLFASGRARQLFGLAALNAVILSVAYSLGVRGGALGVATAGALASFVVVGIPVGAANRVIGASWVDFARAIAPGLGASVFIAAAAALARRAMPAAHPGDTLATVLVLAVAGLAASAVYLACVAVWTRWNRVPLRSALTWMTQVS